MNDDRQDAVLRRLNDYYERQYGSPPDSAQMRQHVAQRRQGIDREDGTMTSLHTPSTPEAEREARTLRQDRRALGIFAAVSMVIVLAVLTEFILSGHSSRVYVHPASSPTSPPSAMPFHTTITIAQLSFTSTTDGWAAGYRRADTAGPDAAPEFPALYHFINGRWAAVDITSAISGYENVGLVGIAMLTPSDGWIATTGVKVSGKQQQTLLLHYDGTQWQPVLADAAGSGALHFASPTCGWSVNDKASLFFDGKGWHPQALPSVVSFVQEASATGSCQIWASGTSINGGQPVGGAGEQDDGLILVNDGNGWRVQQTFKNATVTHITMSSPDDGWANGDVFQNAGKDPNTGGTIVNSTAVLWHYHHGQWQQRANSTDPIGSLMRMRGANRGWAVMAQSADYASKLPSAAFYQFDGQSWQPQQNVIALLPGDLSLNDITFVSADEAWCVGQVRFNTRGFEDPVFFHYQNGQWSSVLFP